LSRRLLLVAPGETVCDEEDGCGCEQGEDDPAQLIVPSVQAFVGQQPSAAVLNDAPDLNEPGPMRLTDFPNVGTDAVTQAKPAVVLPSALAKAPALS
jgi:hypothetical protein